MCELGEEDISVDVSDVDTVETSDTGLDTEPIDVKIEDIAEDMDANISEDIYEENEEIEDIDDIIEDESDEVVDKSEEEVYELEEDVEENLTEESTDSQEVIEENGYEFTKDSEGRVSEIEGDLRLQTGERDVIAQREAGGEFRRDTDDGGHFIGNRFDGPSEDINLFAQNSNLNRGGYKSLENEWARELKQGNDVHVKIDPLYQDGVKRPHALMGEYEVSSDQVTTKEHFSFANENLNKEEFNIDDYDFEFQEEKENK